VVVACKTPQPMELDLERRRPKPPGWGRASRVFAHGRSVVDKTTYLQECCLRHPQLRTELLAFHQKFPALFRRSDHRVPRYKKTPPAWLTALFQFKERPPIYVAVLPRTFEALTQLYSLTLFLSQLGYDKSIEPDTPRTSYFQAMQTDKREWTVSWDALCRRWSDVPQAFLRWCQRQDLHRPTVLVATPGAADDDWIMTVSHTAGAAKIMIPVFDNTTLDDIKAMWDSQIVPSKRLMYSTTRRERPGQYQMRLKVWDAYEMFHTFTDVARSLKERPTTVKSIYLQACRDIFGTSDNPPRTRQQRVLAGFDPATHMQTCDVCKKAEADTAEKLCEQAESYANQDGRSQRDRPYLPEQLARLGSRSYVDERP
jgi:hypothetical protein